MRFRASPRETTAGNLDSARRRKRRMGFALLPALVLALLLVPAAAGASPLGRAAVSFAGAGPDPTASDEQSKIWFNDGAWWAVMWNPVNHDFHIFRFEPGTGRWIDSGTAVDDRSRTRSDTLWDGSHLYVVSHKFSLLSGVDSPTRLYRLSYDPSSRTYSMDDGFPVVVNTHRPRVVVLDKDSKGQLWATWTNGGRLYLNRTLCDPTCDDSRWGTPFTPRVARARVAANDVAALVAFGGDRIGLMWSNQLERRFSFAVHTDGSPSGAWTPA